MKVLPTRCPSCSGDLSVTCLRCGTCETEVHGQFPLPALTRLSPDDQLFAAHFILASGSLKEMARLLGVSYPTVRNRLNDLIHALSSQQQQKSPPTHEHEHEPE